MSNVNFNMFGLDKINNVIYHTDGDGSYGYRAIVNGKILYIQDIETVQGLMSIMPSITINPRDVSSFEQCVLVNNETE